MMRQSGLPLYRSMYTLIIYLYTLVRHFPKEYKYTLGQSILDTGWDTLDSIVIANSLPNDRKADVLHTGSGSFDRLKTRLRVAHELKLITPKRYTYLMSQNEELGKMLGGWLSWADGKESAQARA